MAVEGPKCHIPPTVARNAVHHLQTSRRRAKLRKQLARSPRSLRRALHCSLVSQGNWDFIGVVTDQWMTSATVQVKKRRSANSVVLNQLWVKLLFLLSMRTALRPPAWLSNGTSPSISTHFREGHQMMSVHHRHKLVPMKKRKKCWTFHTSLNHPRACQGLPAPRTLVVLSTRICTPAWQSESQRHFFGSVSNL